MSEGTLADVGEELSKHLQGARRVAVVGIGDELQVHDRLGMLAAREVENLQLPAVKVFLAHTVPESVTGPLRKYRPDRVLLLDAADMDVRPGTVAVVAPGKVRASTLSTHSLPLPVVMEYIEGTLKVPAVLVGLQPDLTASGPFPTPAEEAGITHLVATLQRLLSEPAPRRV